MRIAVIGSNSFSGSHFVAKALSKDHAVLGISRSPEPAAPFLPRKWRSEEAADFQFIQADLNKDLALAVQAIAEFAPDAVVNFAAQSMVGQSWDAPEHWYRTNVVTLAMLANELLAVPTMVRYVHVTTPEVYGSTSDWITETWQFAPSTPYAISRAAGDWHLKAMHEAQGFPVVFTRAANVYGPGQQLYRIVPRAAISARLLRPLPLHGGGGSRRSFIHINDVVEATLKIAQMGEIGTTYHISTNETVSIKELVTTIFHTANVDPDTCLAETPDRAGKDLGYFLDSSHARRELDWEPQVPLLEGLSDVLSWVDSNLDYLSAQPTDYVHRP